MKCYGYKKRVQWPYFSFFNQMNEWIWMDVNFIDGALNLHSFLQWQQNLVNILVLKIDTL